MKRTLILLVVTASVLACASNDQEPPMRPRGGGDYPRTPRATVSSSGIDFLPFTDWWHEPAISGTLNLTNDQYTALDKISADRRDEISRLERDSTVAMRDLRQTLDSNQPTTGDITAAARRVRDLRDTLFERQVQMVAAEREVLTQQQWQTLQQQLQAERSDRRDGNYGGPRRGRGGMGGRGRWPGF